ncbi:amino acid adenylation domain-containing protein [Catenulispora sp. EB89]|uniref:non-ribosomal peptide synthetase n=1 Tax=Catenulispora sp. EB89 TaxID=3156257 RepID=UPI0035112A8D
MSISVSDDVPIPRDLVDSVCHWAAHSPDAVAIEDGSTSVSYRELALSMDRTAATLRDRGVGPDSRIAIAIPRSAGFVVAALAVLRSGGCYVPIDPGYPEARRKMMLADSRAELVLVDDAGPETEADVPTLRLASEAGTPSEAPDEFPAVPDAALAYIIYTSGSTGTPKGVGIPREAVVNLVRDAGELGMQPGDRVGHLAPTAFDAATFEIWAPLCHGGTVVIARDTLMSTTELGTWLGSARLDWLFLTTGLFHLLVEQAAESLADIGVLITGGDILSPHHVQTASARARGQLYAAYGPTETTVFASLHPVTPASPIGERVPLGTGIAGKHLLILDEDLRPAPDGEIAEIYISGPGLARGYHDMPALTAQRFLADPFSTESGGRMYRTGDLGRRQPNGEVEFHGRVDRQVKIRGFRVELGEIEAELQAHESVSGVAAVVDEDAYGKRVVVYAVGVKGSDLDGTELRSWIADRMPEFMRPHNFVVVDRLPLDPNGKVRRQDLPTVLSPREKYSQILPPFREPGTQTEAVIVHAFMDVLQLDRVGADDNFFELGGDSLRTVRVLEQLRSRGVHVTARQFFAHSTPAQLTSVAGT